MYTYMHIHIYIYILCAYRGCRFGVQGSGILVRDPIGDDSGSCKGSIKATLGKLFRGTTFGGKAFDEGQWHLVLEG